MMDKRVVILGACAAIQAALGYKDFVFVTEGNKLGSHQDQANHMQLDSIKLQHKRHQEDARRALKVRRLR